MHLSVSTHYGDLVRATPMRSVAVVGDNGLGGNPIATIVQHNCPEVPVGAGVVIEQLDAQAGAWEFSLDDGQSWKSIRTDLINRPGHMGLALNADVRLRVLPIAGQRVQGVKLAFHTVQRPHGVHNGSYRAYVAEDREDASHTVVVVLSIGAVNGMPPKVHVPRPRNKRRLAQDLVAQKQGVGRVALVSP